MLRREALKAIAGMVGTAKAMTAADVAAAKETLPDIGLKDDDLPSAPVQLGLRSEPMPDRVWRLVKAIDRAENDSTMPRADPSDMPAAIGTKKSWSPAFKELAHQRETQKRIQRDRQLWDLRDALCEGRVSEAQIAQLSKLFGLDD